MNSEKNGKNLEYLSMEESQEVMVKGNAYEKGRGKKPPSKSRAGWLRRRTTLEKSLILLLLILSLVCVVLLIGLIVTAASSVSTMELGGASKSPLSTEGVCTSPECVITAGNVLDSMDLTADPCQDFYQFACGGWNRKHFIPDEEAKYTVFEEVFNRLMEMSRGMLETRSANDSEAVAKAKEFYESCTNVELIDQIGAQPLMDLIEEVGGWPVVAGDSWDEEAWDLEEALAKYRMETDYNFLFRHDFMPDMINAGNYIIIIDQPELSLEDRSFYLREKTDSKLAAYFDYMVDIATVLRPDSDREEARRQMADALEFERALANFSVSSAEMRDMSKYKNRYTTRRLQQEMPQIDWLRYFRLIHTDEFSPDEEIINAAHSYFQKTAAHINATSKRTMANFLMWRIVFEMVEYLDSELRNIRQQFMSATMGQKREQSRWKTCFEKTNNNFGVALGSLFIQKHFDGNSKATAQEMLEDIRETLKETLNEVPWMDDQTRANAIRKASKTKEMIGYDDILTDEQAVNDVYRSIDMSPNRFFENIRAIWQTDARESIAHHGKQVEVLLWKQKLIKINAYYRNADNSLIFPAGIFQPPFYSSQFPKSMNYGGIGMVIGHELMHGFDDKGRRFDEDGIMNQWFSNSSAQAYEERKQCFIAQYSSYYVPEVELYLNGKQAQGEVLADNGGIKEAYLGYKRWVKRVGDPGDTLPGINLNHDQLFFLNFAQMWCSLHRKESLEVIVKAKVHVPERFRVLGTLSNSEHFAEAYQCKKGSAMVRDEPCKLW
ncbi:membrane metallo-endopeptidase-like 1 [Acanthaster planci]|uniref:Membrane metallo-endopeptidase-like 1 n=1 Tax=Acanthaster planci TaxID=133434 RepID=A0A8B7ZEZ3_ACAPL|nr:membrane metallo-endopeptidase-like 1 [Acanthaster planci]